MFLALVRMININGMIKLSQSKLREETMMVQLDGSELTSPPPPPMNICEIYLHEEKFSLKANWKLTERLLYN